MIRLYNNNETDFTGNGIAILNGVKDVRVTRKINGEFCLDFTCPDNFEKWEHIINERICKLGSQCFRINEIDGNSVHAVAIYRDMQHRHLQYVEDMMGYTPRDIMLRLFQDTPIHIMTEAEVEEKGMEWVTERTDFFEASKITPIVGLETLSKTLEKQKAVCELYVDNYNLALVKRIGRDYGGTITLRFNAKSTESSRETSELVTRLYPYGADDLDVSTVNDGKQYVDSPLAEEIGIYEGYSMFDECEDPEELLRLAKWQFDEENLNRIDIPKYNMNIGFVDVSAVYKEKGLVSPKLGDRVKVYDTQLKTTTLQRVIGTVIYPFEPRKSTIEVGQARVTIDSFFSGLCQTQLQQYRQTNGKKEIKTSFLEMMRENVKVSINQALRNEEIAKYKTGALFESPDGSCAVAIIKGQLAIAGRKTDGEWDWTTVVNDNQIIVSEVFTGMLYTNLCTILSDDGKLIIENNLITMKDSSDTVRFECGLSGGQYVFCLYDAKGEKTVYINNDGEAVFAGRISTAKDMEVGANVVVGKDTASGRIDFAGMINDSEGSIEVVDHVMDIKANYVRINGMDVVAEIKALKEKNG